MRLLLFLPAALCFLLPLLNAIVQERREARIQREAAERRRSKAEAAAQAKVEHDAQKAAAKAAKEAEAAAQPKRKRGRPRKTPATAQEAPAPVQAAPEPVRSEPIRPETISAPLPFRGNNAFARQTVAFTGTLEGMTRAEAIRAVESNGGRAFETMPTGTTLLVVGEKPGADKLDKAEQRLGQVRKITQAQFMAMLAAPLTLTIDEFAKAFAPIEHEQEARI